MKRSLPRSLDDVGGMRAARWFRESTAGQWDNFGPDAQREQQDRAIDRYGLVDTGLEWSVAASGWTSAWRTPAWEAMVASAQAGAFDVLVVGYVSRFLRNLKQTLIAVEDHLHAAGVVVLFADERLLSSRPRQLGPVHPGGARGRGVQPEALQAGRRGLRRQAPAARRAGWQPGPVRDHPGGQAVDPPRRRGDGRDRRPGVQPRRRRADRLGGRDPDRPRQDARRGAADQPDLRRATPDRRGGGHRADRRPGAVVDGPDDARAAPDADPGASSSAPMPSACGAPAAVGTSTATSAATATRRPRARRSWPRRRRPAARPDGP